MRRATFLHVAREGWPFITGLALIALVVYVYASLWWAIVPALLALYLVAYFHDPDRRVPAEPLAVIAPIDGRIVHRRECYDPFLDREAIKVSIAAHPLGAYFLRAPAEGTLLEIDAEAWPEVRGTAAWVRTDENDEIVIAASEGAMLGARPCQARYGERIGQGRRCGARRMARRLDLYLPADSRVEVQLNDSVRAGGSVLATLMHKAPNGNG